MAAKVWLKDRWSMLLPLLEPLGNEQEEEIKRLCESEIEYFRTDRGLALGTLGNAVSQTRKHIIEHFKSSLTDVNSWFNARDGEQQHISTKYMNLSPEEWRARIAPSEEKLQARLENQQLLEKPDTIVGRAYALLGSQRWEEMAVALALLTGRRLSELLKTGVFNLCTLYTVMFTGELKRRDAVLEPYEIPVLGQASTVLVAVDRLRRSLDCSAVELDDISKNYGPSVSAAADRLFSDVVPVVYGKDDLYTHMWRSVYPRLAVYYFCPVPVSELVYVPTILGHYWEDVNGEKQRNFMSSLHYYNYQVGDGTGNVDGRKGIWLSDPGHPGVEVLKAFQAKPVTHKKGSRIMQETETGLTVKTVTKTGYSIVKVKDITKSRVDDVIQEAEIHSTSPYDAVVSLLLDEHYTLGTFNQLGVSLDPLASLLSAAAVAAAADVDAQKKAKKKTIENETADPVVYLLKLLSEKQEFKQSYEKRHAGKDYSTMSLTDLRDTKTTEATYERFRRAVAAIMAYNDAAPVADARWYINPSVVTDLVGGKPSLASDYLDSCKDEIDVHHKQHGLTLAYNRRPVNIIYRVAVPERPGEEGNLERQIAQHEEREAKRKAKK